MNPECCGKESKTSKRQSKASHPARKVACFCPPTMHNTKLDQLNKARVKGYSKYCQGRAHAKLLNQHVFKPYIWPDRLDIICLGRFSCTNQVTSVSLSVLCRQRMNISPVTQKKKKKKKKNIWPSHCKAPRSSNNTAHRCSTCDERWMHLLTVWP